MSSGQLYLSGARRLVELAGTVDDSHAITATPLWDMRALLAHLTGVCTDVVSGDVDAYARPEWTEAQVARRASSSRAEIIAEWESAWSGMGEILDDPSRAGLDQSFSVMPLVDLLAHEHDVRESVGLLGFSDPEVWPAVSERRRYVLALQCAAGGLDRLVVLTTDGDEWEIGTGATTVTVRADRYDLWRSLEGRRPREVVRGFEWSSDPEPYLSVWPGFVFHWPED